MSWNSTPIGRGRPPGISDVAFFTEHEDLTEDGAYKIVASHSTGRAFYAARQVLDTDRGIKDAVKATVITKEWTRHEFGWKVEDENLNPEPIFTTGTLLKHLTPIEDLAANVWRDRARKFTLRPSANRGDTIALVEPHRFSDGVHRSRFEVVGHGEMFSLDDGRIVRIDNWREREYVIEAIASQPPIPGLVTLDDRVKATLF